MSSTLELDTAGQVVDAPAQVERRRPGRIENASPQLIPLLRQGGFPPLAEVDDEAFDEFSFEDEDQLAPARGLATALLLSAGVWGLIGYGLFRMM